MECPKSVKGSISSEQIMEQMNVNKKKKSAALPAGNYYCGLSDICQFGMNDGETPNQWFRFVIPIFLHAGLLHLIFNLTFQIRTGIQMEKDFGTWRIMIIYMASGIFGFAFGANYSGVASSVGCSGSLYGK